MQYATHILLGLLFFLYPFINKADQEELAEKVNETISVQNILQERKSLIETIKPSLVTVQYFLRYDKYGKPPILADFDCPGCGRKHHFNGERFVIEERPLEIPGYLIAPDQVLSADVVINPKFVRKLIIRADGAEVNATITRYCVEQPTIILQLDKPLPNRQPLSFAPATAEEPEKLFTISSSLDRGFGQITVRPFKPTMAIELPDIGKEFLPVPPHSIVAETTGTAFGFSTYPGIMNNASWRESPLSWPGLTTRQMNNLLNSVKDLVSHGVFRVKLVFRSPKMNENKQHNLQKQQRIETEFITAGILYDTDKLLIIADLSARDTARLEQILVYTPNNADIIPGSFAGSLRDVGGLIARIPTASQKTFKPVKLSEKSLLAKTWQLLPKANIRIFGEQLDCSFGHTRIEGFEPGQSNRLFPVISGDNVGVFIFSHNLELLAFPLQRRIKIGSSHKDNPPIHTISQACYFTQILQELEQHIDPHNIPLKENEEERLAWLGTEVQPLNSELAKANHVSSLSDNGKHGVLLTYVYPHSPAATAGLKPGDILLRLFVENEPNPIDLNSGDYSARAPFPWEHLDKIPESYLDKIPSPWHSVENQLNLTLTNLGFGKKITIQCFIDGEVANKNFVIEKMPKHYELAPRLNSTELGIIIRNLTYEVRRYFQMTTASPGVIISRVVPGGKAAVSGLKPYEIITRVNGRPVMNVEDFKNLISNQKELRLEIKRMTENRIAKIHQ